MTYELAKQLKDMSFGQSAGVYISYDGEEVWMDGEDADTDGYEGYCYVPTLSELIEACVNQGARFDLLCTKTAYSIWANDVQFTTDSASTFKTPEEAVAKLWLALNKK